MARSSLKSVLFGLGCFGLAACGSAGERAPDIDQTAASQTQNEGPPAGAPTLGLMTSLPVYWPLDADFGDLANGDAEKPWQRSLIEKRFRIEPLDTLSPIPGLTPDDPETDPLADLQRLAVIQPRGLTPLDNVALDEWVRAGGELLLVLDPALTGEYEVPLGDPRRPIDAALIPPIVKRWGMAVTFDEGQELRRDVALDDVILRVALAGTIELIEPSGSRCALLADGAAARCAIGAGKVVLLADAAVFEDVLIIERDFTGERQPLVQLLGLAFP